MKIIICGAGQVGSSIARHLGLDGNDITLIDTSEALINRVTETLEVRGMVGHAAHPDILKAAGAEEADMLIAVTYADEVNMIACQIGYSLFNIPTRIARVRDQSYLQASWQDLYKLENLPIDVVISPEIEVAASIIRRLNAPGALDVTSYADDRLKLLSLHCPANAPVANIPLKMAMRRLKNIDMRIIGVVHNNRFNLPREDMMIQPGDDIHLLVRSEHVVKAMEAFGFQRRESRRVVIIGGGNIGLFLAKHIEQHEPQIRLKLIEADYDRAVHVEGLLSSTTVIHGSGLDQAILDEALVDQASHLLAVTNNDEVNALSSLMAKKSGCANTIALVNNNSYQHLLGDLGIDVTVNPRETTVSTILQHVRRGKIRGVHTIHDGAAEVIEAEALDTSGIIGQKLDELDLPKGAIAAAIVRGDEIIFPEHNEVIQTHDRVIFCALAAVTRDVENMVSVGLEYFG